MSGGWVRHPETAQYIDRMLAEIDTEGDTVDIYKARRMAESITPLDEARVQLVLAEDLVSEMSNVDEQAKLRLGLGVAWTTLSMAQVVKRAQEDDE